MMMKFHHIGIACENIQEVIVFLENTFNIIKKSKIIWHENQGVDACLLTNADGANIELVSGKNIEMTSYQTVFKRLILTGFWLMPWLQNMSREKVFELYNHLAALIDKNILYVPIEKTYNFEEIKKAVAHSAGYNRSGKIILTPNGPF